jgi:hypothetical protein
MVLGVAFSGLKLSAASCGESSILKERLFGIRSLTPQQAAGTALATEFKELRGRGFK